MTGKKLQEQKSRSIRGLRLEWSMSKAYQVVFECPKGHHHIRVQRKSSKPSLSEVEAREMFANEEISCDQPGCGWHGKASRMRLHQIVPFDWIYSPAI
jgi:hypothetical protein